MQQSCTLYLKGNGSTYCLLTQNNQDKAQFFQASLQFSKLICLSLSGYFVMAVNDKGEIWTWGTFESQIIINPKILHINNINVLEVSCGWQHAVWRTSNSVYGIGSNKYGQIGNSIDSLNQQSKYCKNPLLMINEQCSHICAGFRQSYVIKNRQLYGRGQSKNYQLGLSSKITSKQTFTNGWIQIYSFKQKSLSYIKKILCGKKYFLLLTQQQEVFCLGLNEYNMFNIQQTQQQSKYLSSFKKLRFQSIKNCKIYEKVIDISSGWGHILVLTSTNNILSFGRNNLGQLGRNSNQESNKIQFFDSTAGNVQLFCGSQFNFMIVQNVLYGWGWNQHKNIINNNQDIIGKPIKIKQNVHKVWSGPAITIIQNLF